MSKEIRKNSTGVGGGVYGDEGKGAKTDKSATQYVSENYSLINYGVNGGANAGHTVEFGNIRIALHQLPGAACVDGATIILGKGKVLHPADLINEIEEVKNVSNNVIKTSIKIDASATLALDTHRAYENVLKERNSGSKGATGRGISPAYSDILLRHPLRMRDLTNGDYDSFAKHYRFYSDQISGLGFDMANMKVATGKKGNFINVGSEKEFIDRLKATKGILEPLTHDVYDFMKETWSNPSKYAYIFEMAQAVGLDARWGVYPDVTASDTTFAAINASTDGIVDYKNIEHRIGVIKATYMSSVGSRRLPTEMIGDDAYLAKQIRDDAHERGATTGRDRDIAFLDFSSMTFEVILFI